MGSKYQLSIVIITMNRREQLSEALESCLAAKLPSSYEFVIIDNNSTDGTEEIVNGFCEKYPGVNVKYKYEAINLGVGGGRSAGFDLAEGKYLYFLDDDAIISEESRDRFFVEPIEYMERNSNVASITTRIEDSVLKYDRDVGTSSMIIDGCKTIFKYLGGSHFLRKAAFSSPLYLPIQYGSEEYAPSIVAQGKGYYHVYNDGIYIIHKPKVNKWIDGTDSMEKIQRCGTAVTYATKRILYPGIYLPVLFMAYRMRCYKYLRPYEGSIKKSDKMAKSIIKNNKLDKIKFTTVIRLYKEFGLTVF